MTDQENGPPVRWVVRTTGQGKHYPIRKRVLQYREERRYADRAESVWVDVPTEAEDSVPTKEEDSE